jgi:hypothetical protein
VAGGEEEGAGGAAEAGEEVDGEEAEDGIPGERDGAAIGQGDDGAEGAEGGDGKGARKGEDGNIGGGGEGGVGGKAVEVPGAAGLREELGGEGGRRSGEPGSEEKGEKEGVGGSHDGGWEPSLIEAELKRAWGRKGSEMEVAILRAGGAHVGYCVAGVEAPKAYRKKVGRELLARLGLEGLTLVVEWKEPRHPVLGVEITRGAGAEGGGLDSVLEVIKGERGLGLRIRDEAYKARRSIRVMGDLEEAVGRAPPGEEAPKELRDALEWERGDIPPIYELVKGLGKLRWGGGEGLKEKAQALIRANEEAELPELVPVGGGRSHERAERVWMVNYGEAGPELRRGEVGLRGLARVLRRNDVQPPRGKRGREASYDLVLKMVRAFRMPGEATERYAGVYVVEPELRALKDKAALVEAIPPASSNLSALLGADLLFLGVRRGPDLFWGIAGDADALTEAKGFWTTMLKDLSERWPSGEGGGAEPPYRFELA